MENNYCLYSNNLYNEYKDIVSKAVDALYHYVILDKEARIVYINNKYCEFLNVNLDEVRGKYFSEIVPNTRIYQTIESGVAKYDALFEFIDGRQLVYSILPIKNAAGDTIGAASLSSLNAGETVNELYKEIRKLKLSNELYSKQLKGLSTAPSIFDDIVGKSNSIMDIKITLMSIINSGLPILITGESGTGKEVFANAIHNASNRKDAPFVKVNCAAIPKELLESELFGYETGTFSGALRGGKAGKFELANNGTILLDEIEELPLEMQSKLLRVLQEFEVERIGSVKPINLNLQVICCSNRNLYERVREKQFREDLLYRINVLEINVPPLRDRKDDIPLLCESLIEKINRKYKLNIAGISNRAINYLSSFDWPGNVRELEHALTRASAIHKNGELVKEDFSFLEKSRHLYSNLQHEEDLPAKKKIVSKESIKQAIISAGGNKTNAAKILGISRAQLYNKIKEYDIK